jgi:hypothetical protein
VFTHNCWQRSLEIGSRYLFICLYVWLENISRVEIIVCGSEPAFPFFQICLKKRPLVAAVLFFQNKLF